MSKIRWGIVGAARVNERLMPAIIHSTDGELVAIGSRRPGAAKECLLKHAPDLEDQVQCFDGLDQVINHERVDAIYIPLANEEHVPTALKAIRAKKHVLIEKPMALKSQEVQMLFDEAKNIRSTSWKDLCMPFIRSSTVSRALFTPTLLGKRIMPIPCSPSLSSRHGFTVSTVQ